ncbi:unnamed protein product [Arctogadus glacialis]
MECFMQDFMAWLDRWHRPRHLSGPALETLQLEPSTAHTPHQMCEVGSKETQLRERRQIATKDLLQGARVSSSAKWTAGLPSRIGDSRDMRRERQGTHWLLLWMFGGIEDEVFIGQSVHPFMQCGGRLLNSGEPLALKSLSEGDQVHGRVCDSDWSPGEDLLPSLHVTL